MIRLITIFTILLALVPIYGQDAAPRNQDVELANVQPEPPAIEILHTELDAVGWAFDALAQYPEEDRSYIRFVYLPPYATPNWVGVMDTAINMACSQSPILHRSDRFAGGYLLGYNLRRLCPQPAQLERLINVWDGIAVNESQFHVPQINVQKARGTERAVETKIALLAPHLQEALAKHATDATQSERIDVLVTQLTNSTGGIYPAAWFLEQLLTSVRGKYPEFRQIDFTSVEGFTPFQSLLKKRGFFFEQSLDLNGAKGAYLIQSDITGKNRLILATYGLSGGRPMVVTFDIKDNRTRPDEQFVRNLITFDPLVDASEAFIPMTNGLIEYVLADGAGNIQRVAPPDIVADDNKPRGHTKELEMGMSCVICHSPENGYKSLRNDMEFILGADVDFVGEDYSLDYTDRSGQSWKLTRDEAISILASRFGERIDDPDGVLGRARRDFIRSVDVLTEYPVVADGNTAVQQLGEDIQSIYHGYRYRKIGAQQVLLELGIKAPAEQSLSLLRQIVPPSPAGQREDILISLLRNGAELKRDDMDGIFVEMARRAVITRPQLKAALEQEN